MKKFLPYIFILVIIVQLFAPFGFGGGKNNIKITEADSINEEGINDIYKPLREASKEDCLNSNLPLKNFCLMAAGLNNGKDQSSSLFIYLIGQRPVKSPNGTELLTLTITDDLGNTIKDDNDLEQWEVNQDQGLTNKNDPNETKYDGYIFGLNKINGLEKGRKYTVKIEVLKGIATPPASFTVDGIYISEDGNQTLTNTTSGNNINENSFLPACNPINGYLWTGEGTFMGCIVQLFYYVGFVPTSWLFGLTGVMLDSTVHFSIQDSSYRSPFVVEGWKIVRDFCNIFFIFVLLYIAFGTILKVHGVKTQEMIVNVVIIGLLINFSLFATQVIIDASNILTRVFYNSSAIKITEKGANGVAENTPRLKIGANGEIPISAAIVNRVNPQQIILNGQKEVENYSGTSIDTNEGNNGTSLGIGSWLILVIMAIIVNVIGIIAFLTASLIFITRVIGLWMAMIFAPLAFFSYIVPQLQDTKMIGWKKWWPDTLKMAFLAPIFVFFLYLIVMFLETGLGLVSSNLKDKGGLSFFVFILVPMVFIMILIMKAKDVAKDMSGELGQSITKGIAALGAVALGGAALGAASLMRGTIGATAKYVQNDNARDKDKKLGSNVKDIWSKTKWYNPIGLLGAAGKTLKATGKVGAAWSAEGVHKVGIGKFLQKEEKGLTEKKHAEHELNAKTSEMADKLNVSKDTKYSELIEPQQQQVKNALEKDEISKYFYNGSKFNDLKQQNEKNSVQDWYDRGARVVETERNGKKEKGISFDIGNNQQTVEYKDGSSENFDNKKHHYQVDHYTEVSKTNAAFGEFSKALRTGTYDLRNISKLATSSKGLAKFGVGLAATLATGVRMGLKGSGIDHGTGTGKGNFAKDLGTIISDSLKNMKVDVKVDHGGGGHGKASGGHSAGGHH